ncbi:ABC transporter permease [Microbacterium limosum]|uniref:ABC transporter permease n=1 Tax=Microbacterium limosum TaxID=3079935 RepID=A0AAU0MHQ3_9MICO|nr:ABC transporter permease [Microbacterium sp. Y20]WOQ70056.1 ABC transporter permease [Microbacterium sp. Y20]
MSTNTQTPPRLDTKALSLLGGTSWPDRLRAAARGAGLVAVIIALFVAFGVASPSFVSGNNVIAILLQASVVGVLAIGQTYVLITGGIDLSIGSIVAVSAISAGMFSLVVPPVLAILGGIAVGALAGLVNGLLITLTGITPFIITLGTMSIYSGLALIISGGRAIYEIPQGFKDILAGRIAGIPMPIIIVIVLTVASALILKFTTFGEYLIAVGGAAETARLAGIKVKTITAGSYVVSGAAAGLAGAILVARLGAADPTIGADLLLIAIAATVMGGTKLTGGEGSMFGALFGAILIATLTAGLTSLNVQAFYQQVAVGAAIIIALLIDQVARRARRA